MDTEKNFSAPASALQIVLAISLLWISSILLASSFASAFGNRGAERSTSSWEFTFTTASKGPAEVGNAPAVTCNVTSIADSGTGTLRACLARAANTIDATGVSGTILLTSGELQVTHSVTINGPGSANLAVDGNATFRVFDNFASNVTMSGLTITNRLGSGGGGILNQGGLTLSHCTVSNNVAGLGCCYEGGGIYNGAILTVTDSTISGNSASFDGGGIYNLAQAPSGLTVLNSTISGNFFTGTDQAGGGIMNGGDSTVSNSNHQRQLSPPRRRYVQLDRKDDTNRRYCAECRHFRRNNIQQQRHDHLPRLQPRQR